MAEVTLTVRRTDLTAEARLAAIVDSSFDAIIAKDLDSVITDWNQAAQRLFGYTAEEAVGQSVLMLIPEHRHKEEVDIIERIRRGERIAGFETTRQRKDGTLVEVSLTISPIRDPGGRIVGASKIARDITEAKEAERRIKLLMREVNHRVKNQFAVILSMIREIGKHAGNAREFEARIRERIMALSRSHDLLVGTDWAGANLRDLIEENLEPFGHEDRITLTGPALRLQPAAVQHLGMAFHELGTNSAKYGALSGETGAINIDWTLGPGPEGKSQLELVWNETSAERQPEAPAKAVHKGFGTVVLQRVTPLALNGTASLERSPGRLKWTLIAPLGDEIVATPGTFPAA